MVHTLKCLIVALALVGITLSSAEAGFKEELQRAMALEAGLKEELQKAREACDRGDCKRFIEYVLPLAERGEPLAQFAIASFYSDRQSVPQDDKIAVKWYLKAAEQGHADSQYNLSLFHIYNRGGLSDLVQAHKWAILAARQGQKNATKARDLAASILPPAEIAEAIKLAEEFKLR